MRIHMPRRPNELEIEENYYGVLRELKKHRRVNDDRIENQWVLKITLPRRSNVDNMYLTMDDQEIEYIGKTIAELTNIGDKKE